MGFFKSTKGSLISDYFKLLEDVGGIKKNNAVDVAIYNDRVEISTVGDKVVKLSLDKITDVYYGVETEITQKNKSVIGRAVAGGLIFGGAGAVVGAISGMGTKDKKKRRFIFIISYKNSEGEDAFISFEDTRLYKGTKVYKQLKSLLNLPDESGNVTEL